MNNDLLTVVCVQTGHKYSFKYVLHLRRMVAKHLPLDHQFICLTDQPHTDPQDIHLIDIAEYHLKGWFAKMLVFNRDVVGPGKILYIDLDMVIAGSLLPLVSGDFEHYFGICQNFTQIRQAKDDGRVTWPCGFGSCVMLLGEGYGPEVWDKFWPDSWDHIVDCKQYGDQYIIEKLTAGNAILLQDILPAGYFLHYKDFTDEPDPDAAILVFAGKNKPIDCQIPWIKQLWICP